MPKKQNKTIDYKDYIVNQKEVFKSYEESLRKFGFSDKDIESNLKKQAKYQIESIEKYKPNQMKPVEEQLNPFQLEYWEWLNKVADTGKL